MLCFLSEVVRYSSTNRKSVDLSPEFSLIFFMFKQTTYL